MNKKIDTKTIIEADTLSKELGIDFRKCLEIIVRAQLSEASSSL